MKSSYTKRALAFWLAVAMVATSAPMAFAADLATGVPTSPTVTSEPAPAAEQITINHIGLTENGKVTVDGSSEKTVQATAYSSSDTTAPIDNSKLTWSISGEAGSGVSIDATGKITIAAKAKAGTYTVTATPKDGVATEEAKTATLTVEHDAKAATISKIYVETTSGKIDITDNKSIEIPA